MKTSSLPESRWRVLEALAADQAGEGGDGEPGSGVAGFAVEAGELLFGDVLQVAGELGGKAEAVAGALGVDRFEQLLEFRNRQRDALAQEHERLALGRNGRVENDIGEQAAEQRPGGMLEVIVVALAGGLAAEPADDGLKVEQGAIGGGIDPVERVEGIGVGILGIERHHAMAQGRAGPDRPDGPLRPRDRGRPARRAIPGPRE